MERKIVVVTMLTLLLASALTVAFDIQPVRASGTIYIRADGSIDPPTAPIQRDSYTSHASNAFFKTGLTFPIGTFAIPMDEKQNLLTTGNVTVYGFIWAILDAGANIYRIIEPPDITLKTTTYPGGTIYSGGVILVMSMYGGIIQEKRLSFPNVTIDTLTEPFGASPDQLFFVEKPTKILVIQGIWGHTDVTLDWMKIPYTLVTCDALQTNATIIHDYDLVVDDCPGWSGSMPTNVAANFTEFTNQGGEVIFTDIALADLAQVFPDYVNVVDNVDWIGNVSIHNPPLTGFSPEFPSQYPTTFPNITKIYTMGGGRIVDTILNKTEVRALMDTSEYGGANRTLAFYFPYGNGLIEGFAYHPQEQTEDITFDPYSYVVSSTFYGNKFIHTIPPPAVDEWPIFRHDLTHTGYSTSTAPTTNQTLWSARGFLGVESSPAVAGGVVYVGSGDNKVYALNAMTGTQVWSYTTGGEVKSSPAVAGGVVFVGSYDGKVYALNATTGAFIWNYGPGWGGFSSPAVAGGVVYVGLGNNKVYALNATTGTLVWSYTTGGGVASSPAVAGGVVYVGSFDNKVYALNATTGTLVWSYTTGGEVVSSPAVAGGKVYVGSDDRNVYCLDAATGTRVWNYTTGDYVESSPAVAGGVVYVGSYDNKTYALNAATGALIWSYTTGNYVFSSPAVAGGVVYVGSFDGKFYALNAMTGAFIWSYTTGRVYSSPAVVDGVVYVGSYEYDAKVYAFGVGVHDVAVTNVASSKSVVGQGFSASINVTASNPGDFTETFNVTTYCNLTSYTQPQGLVGYWKLDEGSGTTAHDSSGYNDDGTLMNGPAWVNGKYGKALSFDGMDDYVAISTSTSANPSLVFVEAWIKTNTTAFNRAGPAVIVGDYNTSGGYDLTVQPSGKAYACFRLNPQLGFAQLTGNKIVTDGQWHHIAAYYDNVNTVYIYVDGQLDRSGNDANGGAYIAKTSPVYIGNNPGTTDSNFNGTIDEVRIYNRTLSQQEIVADMTPYGIIGTKTLTLTSGNAATVTFTWNTTGFAYGNYTISAYAQPVPGETNTANNNFTGGLVNVVVPGDVDGNGRVDMGDISALCDGFGSTIGPDGSYWHHPAGILDPFSPNLDIDGNGKIDMGDIVTALGNFGQHYP